MSDDDDRRGGGGATGARVPPSSPPRSPATAAAAAAGDDASAAMRSPLRDDGAVAPALLEFQRDILSELLDKDGLLILGHGLGLLQLLTAMVEAYCDPNFLVVLLNLSTEEETRLVSDLALRRVDCLPKTVNNEVGVKERGEIYLNGGVISITSLILVTDILAARFPIENVDVVIVNHAHRVSETSMDAFVLNLFRERNRKGFVRALSEKPEEFVSGFDKLGKAMRMLYVKKVHLRPRFHITVGESLNKHPLDTVELCQNMTDSMIAVQKALLDVMENCLFELKQANPHVDVSELTVANAMYKSFDQTMQQQFDPIWNRVTPKSKQLLADLKTLRRLLTALTSYDCVTFWMYLESFLTDHFSMGHHSSWLLLDSANDVFKHAQARVYRLKQSATSDPTKKAPLTKDSVEPILEPNPKWGVLTEVLDEIAKFEKEAGNEDYSVLIVTDEERTCTQLRDYLAMGSQKYLERLLTKYFRWKECLPKLTANIAQSRDADRGSSSRAPGTPGPASMGRGRGAQTPGSSATPARGGMAPKRRRGSIIAAGGRGAATPTPSKTPVVTSHESQIMADFLNWFPSDDFRAKHSLANKLRTALAGQAATDAASSSASSTGNKRKASGDEDAETSSRQRKGKQKAVVDVDDADAIVGENADDVVAAEPAMDDAPILNDSGSDSEYDTGAGVTADATMVDDFDPTTFDTSFGLLPPPHVVIQSTQHVLANNVLYDMRPKYIVLYDPTLEMLRHAEVYRAQHPGRPMRCYFTFYEESVEEQRYLRTIQREVEAFEHLIKEKASLAIRDDQDGRAATFWDAQRPAAKLTTTRHAGGMIVAPKVSKVVVDMREFRSSLPMLLHQRGMEIVPVTLEVGDYILSPRMCLERKSIPDLIGSLSSGRLYYQAEAMCQHYEYAILLIEFEQSKAFALQTIYDIKDDISPMAISSRLTLLTIHFPKLRIVWSTSPAQTAEICELLKKQFGEPDADTAAALGVESDAINSDYNIVPQDVLHHLPGVNGSNYRILMRKARSLRELSAATSAQLEEWINNKPGSDLFKFINKDSRV